MKQLSYIYQYTVLIILSTQLYDCTIKVVLMHWIFSEMPTRPHFRTTFRRFYETTRRRFYQTTRRRYYFPTSTTNLPTTNSEVKGLLNLCHLSFYIFINQERESFTVWIEKLLLLIGQLL